MDNLTATYLLLQVLCFAWFVLTYRAKIKDLKKESEFWEGLWRSQRKISDSLRSKLYKLREEK